MKPNMKLIGAGLTALGLLFTIVGTATPSWASREQSVAGFDPTTFGLNSICTYVDSTEIECRTYSDFLAKVAPGEEITMGGWLDASMAFAIMAILALVTATMAMAGHAVMKKDQLKIPAVGAAGFGIVCQLVAISIFASNFDTKDDPDTTDVREGFYDPVVFPEDITAGPAMILMVLAMLVNVAGVGVYFVMGSKNPPPKVEPEVMVVQQPQIVVQQQP